MKRKGKVKSEIVERATPSRKRSLRSTPSKKGNLDPVCVEANNKLGQNSPLSEGWQPKADGVFLATSSDINKIFSILSKQNPEPKTELQFTNNYTLLVAVVLSAQSTDVGVNKATKELFKIADTPEKMLKLGEEKLKKYINTIGLYNGKAKNIIALSKILKEEHNSEVPEDLEILQSLPGVGRKTANVVLNCAFGHPTIAVDTHVFRVSNRIGIVSQKDVLKTELALLKNIPKKWQQHAHHWLILHGRYVCVARKPKCGECAINQYCLKRI